MKTKVQVRDLKKGDVLGSCKIIADPQHLGNYCGQKDRMLLQVVYGSGETSTRIWGKHTTVTVNR